MTKFRRTLAFVSGGTLMVANSAQAPAAGGCEQLEMLRKHAQQRFGSILGKKKGPSQFESTHVLPGAKTCDVEQSKTSATYHCEFFVSQDAKVAKPLFEQYAASWIACIGKPNSVERNTSSMSDVGPLITVRMDDSSTTSLEIDLDYFEHWWRFNVYYKRYD
jgi:hypothetical protein